MIKKIGEKISFRRRYEQSRFKDRYIRNFSGISKVFCQKKRNKLWENIKI